MQNGNGGKAAGNAVEAGKSCCDGAASALATWQRGRCREGRTKVSGYFAFGL
jgi:hypothetical protein